MTLVKASNDTLFYSSFPINQMNLRALKKVTCMCSKNCVLYVGLLFLSLSLRHTLKQRLSPPFSSELICRRRE